MASSSRRDAMFIEDEHVANAATPKGSSISFTHSHLYGLFIAKENMTIPFMRPPRGRCEPTTSFRFYKHLNPSDSGKDGYRLGLPLEVNVCTVPAVSPPQKQSIALRCLTWLPFMILCCQNRLLPAVLSRMSGINARVIKNAYCFPMEVSQNPGETAEVVHWKEFLGSLMRRFHSFHTNTLAGISTFSPTSNFAAAGRVTVYGLSE